MPPAMPSAARPRQNLLARLQQRVGHWPELMRQRHALSHLDTRALRDIGLTPEAARTEAARPPWDAPGHWTD
ncbi:DUF1127 domain-containing protein [Sagittula sp. M10.9X]|uniref:DUF1127 domain-containing protein n=2 Tax=Sagittula salina TaxID=2820268 RepID=A0A940MNE2_9RHOB|nr:DUF1127 domain-containing protein [Sagittula salina]MBP0481718.1 DUF1127 domain-containing protein [Sagittula salina]